MDHLTFLVGGICHSALSGMPNIVLSTKVDEAHGEVVRITSHGRPAMLRCYLLFLDTIRVLVNTTTTSEGHREAILEELAQHPADFWPEIECYSPNLNHSGPPEPRKVQLQPTLQLSESTDHVARCIEALWYTFRGLDEVFTATEGDGDAAFASADPTSMHLIPGQDLETATRYVLNDASWQPLYFDFAERAWQQPALDAPAAAIEEAKPAKVTTSAAQPPTSPASSPRPTELPSTDIRSAAHSVENCADFLQRGGDPNQADGGNHGYTALHYAAKRGNLEVAKLLLDCGADPALETWLGDTAMMIAKAAEHRAMVKLLNGEPLSPRDGAATNMRGKKELSSPIATTPDFQAAERAFNAALASVKAEDPKEEEINLSSLLHKPRSVVTELLASGGAYGVDSVLPNHSPADLGRDLQASSVARRSPPDVQAELFPEVVSINAAVAAQDAAQAAKSSPPRLPSQQESLHPQMTLREQIMALRAQREAVQPTAQNAPTEQSTEVGRIVQSIHLATNGQDYLDALASQLSEVSAAPHYGSNISHGSQSRDTVAATRPAARPACYHPMPPVGEPHPSTTTVRSDYATSQSQSPYKNVAVTAENGGPGRQYPSWSYVTPSPGRHLPAVTPGMSASELNKPYDNSYDHYAPWYHNYLQDCGGTTNDVMSQIDKALKGM